MAEHGQTCPGQRRELPVVDRISHTGGLGRSQAPKVPAPNPKSAPDGAPTGRLSTGGLAIGAAQTYFGTGEALSLPPLPVPPRWRRRSASATGRRSAPPWSMGCASSVCSRGTSRRSRRCGAAPPAAPGQPRSRCAAGARVRQPRNVGATTGQARARAVRGGLAVRPLAGRPCRGRRAGARLGPRGRRGATRGCRDAGRHDAGRQGLPGRRGRRRRFDGLRARAAPGLGRGARDDPHARRQGTELARLCRRGDRGLRRDRFGPLQRLDGRARGRAGGGGRRRGGRGLRRGGDGMAASSDDRGGGSASARPCLPPSRRSRSPPGRPPQRSNWLSST